jgi:hypothetical protein
MAGEGDKESSIIIWNGLQNGHLYNYKLSYHSSATSLRRRCWELG